MPLRANIDANFILVKDYSTLITRDMQERYKKTTSNLKSLNEYEADVKADAGTSPYIIDGIQALQGGTARRSRVMETALIRVVLQASMGSMHS